MCLDGDAVREIRETQQDMGEFLTNLSLFQAGSGHFSDSVSFCQLPPTSAGFRLLLVRVVSARPLVSGWRSARGRGGIRETHQGRWIFRLICAFLLFRLGHFCFRQLLPPSASAGFRQLPFWVASARPLASGWRRGEGNPRNPTGQWRISD